ncbi:GspH/FimT family pseudopilin [Methylobacillus flagellatus]|uniref:Type II secretion system protein H n=1 Tax=Methylobacillus flagellatus (strain ATCC 51484 / DSM 6875 / VKM B-1610 / KT) TaxID=265072 RepID=Q1GYA0_METFK|nr:GspH/FimT family pseudopilin [Methylobacillus flagellatus]ABE50787.1 methylation [Methylobacillus flagellatus KT]
MRAYGFTLVELVVTLTILTILLAMAAPSFREMLLNFQIRSAAEGLNTGLQIARAEAIRRNVNVVFTLSSNATWTVGCQVVVADADNDGVEDCPEVIQGKQSAEGAVSINVEVVPAGAHSVTFNGLGRVTFNNDGSNVMRQLDIAANEGNGRNLRILIRGGSVHFCDPSISTVGDPRVCA